jgi:uncharacterized protein YdeI (BOF family)
MATLVTPTNLQKLEYDVTTGAGPSRVTVVTGIMPVFLQATANQGTQSGSFKALVDPQLNPGQFIKATANANLNNLTTNTNVTLPSSALWRIDEVEATFDDESGKIQLRIDATIGSGGANSFSNVQAFGFQVTTLAKI